MDNFLLFLLAINLIISGFMAVWGDKTSLGGWATFAISLVFSPFIALVVILVVKSKDDAAAAKLESMQPIGSKADELIKLKQLHDNGVLTDSEFESAKQKIL